MKSVEKTKTDCTVCPHCGCCDTDFIDAWANEDGSETESRQCCDCQEFYEVTFDEDENIIDIRDHLNHSLLKGENIK